MTNTSGFQYKFLNGLIHDCYEYRENNIDFLRFGINTPLRIKSQLKDKALVLARRAGFVRRNNSIEEVSERLAYTVKHIEELENFYDLLQDNCSKELLIELLKFRILGSRRVKLPLNDKAYWAKLASIDQHYLKERRTIRIWNWYLNRYRLQRLTGPLELHAHPLHILNTFLLEQYAYQKGHRNIYVEPGDVVIDGGACWGDTSLYFADKAGPRGKVYSFEFVPKNLEILDQNINANPHIANIIQIVPSALWDQSNEKVGYSTNGPATSLDSGEQNNSHHASTLSIDDFAEQEGLNKVDFIKMDIEGSELKALRGAKKTICRFRPKLAISLYHKDEDFIVIPRYLNELTDQYEFFLDHFTIHQEETVLFAIAKSN